jgi:hypothetical protein
VLKVYKGGLDRWCSVEIEVARAALHCGMSSSDGPSRAMLVRYSIVQRREDS